MERALGERPIVEVQEQIVKRSAQQHSIRRRQCSDAKLVGESASRVLEIQPEARQCHATGAPRSASSEAIACSRTSRSALSGWVPTLAMIAWGASQTTGAPPPGARTRDHRPWAGYTRDDGDSVSRPKSDVLRQLAEANPVNEPELREGGERDRADALLERIFDQSAAEQRPPARRRHRRPHRLALAGALSLVAVAVVALVPFLSDSRIDPAAQAAATLSGRDGVFRVTSRTTTSTAGHSRPQIWIETWASADGRRSHSLVYRAASSARRCLSWSGWSRGIRRHARSRWPRPGPPDRSGCR